MPGTQIFRGAALLMVVCTATALLIPARAAAQTYSFLYSFSWTTDGTRPFSPVTFDAAGNLYGTTSFGGLYPNGTVYELSPGAGGTWTEKVLHGFNPANGKDGFNAAEGVTLDSAGNLYGTTIHGGTLGEGIAYKLTPGGNGWAETILYNFGKNFASYPSRVILDGAGNLYGTAGGGTAGIVFELVPNASGGWRPMVLHSFTNNGQDGLYPQAGVTLDKAGNLYGTTYGGGAYNYGTVFEMTKTGGKWSEKVIYSFQGSGDGCCPENIVAIDASGNLYGTTAAIYDYGTVFQLSPQAGGGWKKTTLHTFQNNGVDGILPEGMLAIDGAGNVYGATGGGGLYTFGILYKLTPSTGGWTESILYNFNLNTGEGSSGSGFILDGAGNLYGTSAGGGAYTGGAVFEVTP